MNRDFRFSRVSEDSRLKHIYRQKLETEDVREVHKALQFLWRTAGMGFEGDGAFILGETGAGKTTAVRMFTDAKFEEMRDADPSGEWSRPKMPGTDLRPIIHSAPGRVDYRPIAAMSVNSMPRYKSFMHDAAHALQVGLASNADFGEASWEVQNALEKQRVKMFIFDDVQHIIEAHMTDYKAADVFKLLLKSRVQIVCVGLTKSHLLSTVNPQLRRLVRMRRTVTPLRCSIGDFPPLDRDGNPINAAPGIKTQFRKLMEAIDRKAGEDSILPFDGESNLSHPRMALRIHQATEGYVGEIMKLIQQAAALAILDGRSKISKDDFEQAYRDKTSCDDDANWFHLSWPTLVERFGTITPAAHEKAEKDAEDVLKVSRKMAKTKRVEDAIAGRR
ncbi:hypothetical protein ABIF69_004488 [Bradyrhizobium japonicum]